MKKLISEKYRQLIWKDEINDTFLLTKYCEIYKYSKTTLGLYIWSRKMCLQLQNMGLISKECYTDDGLYCCFAKVKDLDVIIQLGAFKRRPHKKGKWIKDKEKRLAHRILLFRGKLIG